MLTSEFFDTVEARFHDWHGDGARILYSLIRWFRPETVVEVGCYRGYSACYMARALQENGSGHLYCIDDFSQTDHAAQYGDPRQHMEGNLEACGVRDAVTIIEGRSDAVEWPDRVDFCFVDGWHGYEACRRDTERAMRTAHIVVIDDVVSTIGPRKVMDEARWFVGWDMVCLPQGCGLMLLCRQTPLPKVRFEQEMPSSPGVAMDGMNDSERRVHFERIRVETGNDFGEYR